MDTSTLRAPSLIRSSAAVRISPRDYSFRPACSCSSCRLGFTRKGEADRPLRTFAYFDMVRDDWRAFRPESIVESGHCR